jgi:hypothetical protein
VNENVFLLATVNNAAIPFNISCLGICTFTEREARAVAPDLVFEALSPLVAPGGIEHGWVYFVHLDLEAFARLSNR